RGPGGEAHVAQLPGVAQPGPHDQAADAAGGERGGEQLAERAVGGRRRGGDDDDVARLRLLDGGVDHQVVARPADHGQRDAGDPRALLVRAQGGPEVPAAADGLVDGGDAVRGGGGHRPGIGGGGGGG